MAYSRPYPAPPQPYSPSPGPVAPAAQPAAVPPSIPVPPGTLPPGTVVNVGDYQVVVDRFLSEGGFAHVYLATSAIPLPVGSPRATTKHVLKRMSVPDKRGVHEVGKEVEVMRQLKNHPKIVNMIEASVADLPGGVDGSKGYEIYILMEWCAGGGIIDMMNTRLQNRMTESEILKIFSDTVEAVAHMHYQSPPLIHRDLKVENILLTPPQTYKLCDFGSTTKPLPREKVPTAVEGIQKIELEINKTTTLQYRAPELVDVWGRKGFDEKIDIWALGVLLYKLCYYTTPFEENGPLAILNAQYKFLPYPAYSPQIRSLISSMLQERPENRPNIYQVHEMTCRLRGVAVRMENKYALQAASTGGLRSQLPAAATLSRPSSAQPPAAVAPTANILSHQGSASSPNLTQLAGMQGLASQVSPMRRGRPGKLPANGSEATAPPGESHALSHPSGSANGFADSFSPNHSLGQSKSPEIPLATEVEMPKNMGMFRDLVSPKPDGDTERKIQEQKERDADEERKRFESTFPALLDDDLAPFGPTSSSAPAAASETMPKPPMPVQQAPVASPKPIKLELTGEGPPLPRRPPNASPAHAPSVTSPPSNAANISTPINAPGRPLLVERASQTSPHLLASWKNGSGSSSDQSAPAQPSTASQNGRSGLRQSSIPEFDLSSPTTPGESSKPAAPVLDLLGDDDDHALDSFAPGTVPLPTSPQPSAYQPKSPALPPKPSFDGGFASKRASFVLAASTSQAGVLKERERFKPVRKSTGSANGNTEGPTGTASDKTAPGESSAATAPAEERFPALPESQHNGQVASNSGKEFEEVVERDEQGPDSSDDETATPVPQGKVGAPSFSDDEDFCPRSVQHKSASLPSRPAFGTKMSSQSSLANATNRISLADSPTPADGANRSSESLPSALSRPARTSTMSSFSSSEGGGDIDLGPALASIRKFAPSGNNSDRPILDEQDEDELSPPSVAHLSSSNTTPTSTLPPLASTVPSATVPVAPSPSTVSSSAAPTTGFVPTRAGSAQAPPLVAPKPRKPAGINSLVSRYEGMGTALTGGPPPVGSKPVGLRKDSTGSNASLGRDAVNPRPLPPRGTSATSVNSFHSKVASPEPRSVYDEKPSSSFDSHSNSSATEAATSPKPSTTTTRLPFKPVPPSATPPMPRSRYSMVGLAAAQTSALPTTTLNAGAGDANNTTSRGADDDDEEKFAGVRNMKSRWESMAKQRGDDADRGGGPAGKRKSWAQI